MRKLKEQITGNAAMVFHGSKEREVYKYLCEGQWICSNGVYGDGLYTVYDLSGTQTEDGGYGNYILKLYVGNLSKYWCFTWATFQKVHPIWAKHTNEDEFIDYQAEKFKLKEDDYPKELGNLYDSYRYYPEFLETVDGIIYHGKHDGDCILSYNPYNCRPLAISIDKGKTWEKIDEEYIQQYKQTLSNPKVNKSFYNSFTSTHIIPDNATEIENYAFDSEGIRHITIPNSITRIGEYAFIDCVNLSHIHIPDSVTEIGEGAFKNCLRLKTVILGSSVTEIKSFTFYGCENLTNITIPNSVTKIRKGAFIDCSSLKELTIPNSVTEIEKYAFRECSSLKELIIPNSITEIRKGTFVDCSHLMNITIPKSVTKIGEGAFDGCYGLLEVNYEGTEDEWNQIEGIDESCIYSGGIRLKFKY